MSPRNHKYLLRSKKQVQKKVEENWYDTNVTSDLYIDIEKIVNKRIRNGEVQYYIKWKDYGEDGNTWEPLYNLDCAHMLKEFEKQWELKKANEKEKKMKTKSRQLGKKHSKSSSSGSLPPPSSSSSTSITKSSKSLSSKSSVCEHKSVAQEEDVKIIGVVYENCQMNFKIRFGGPQPKTENVPFKTANIKWPQIVIKFYEKRLVNLDPSLV